MTTAGIEMQQSQTAMLLHIVTHAQSLPSPDEDQQQAVETSGSTSK